MADVTATTTYSSPPEWALAQQRLFDLMAEAVERFTDEYLDDGEPLWPPEKHVGIDGFDDVVEGFYNWPLVYAMGGDEIFLDRAQETYEAALERGAETETPFGHPMVVEEFEQCRDWFHLGEGNLYTYNVALAAPHDQRVRERAERFAGLYLGDGDVDPGSPAGDTPVDNYDPERRLVRGPMNGSMGPDFCDFSAYEHHPYGAEYRWARHGLPWRDLEFDSAADLLDPDNEERLFEVLNERCATGDIPLNLSITSLMTNAYLHTGADRYRKWVTDYLDAWRERTAANDGVIPDNVSRDGEIGGVAGSWYGGYYGWSWGGWHYIGIGPTVAAENATLLTGDREPLDFPRSQLDRLIERGIKVSEDAVHDTLYIPHKFNGESGDYHYDASGVLTEDDGEVLWKDGFYEFKPHSDDPYAVHLWQVSQREDDRERIRRLQNWSTRKWKQVDLRPSTKHGDGHEYAWLAYLDGEFENYPERILEANHAHVRERLSLLDEEGGPPVEVDEDYLRNRNPVSHMGLLQLTMGAPQQIYYGGLVMAQLRHFDPQRRRPGLPEGVSALVSRVDGEGVSLTLVNDASSERAVVVQGGAYGEHTVETVAWAGERAQSEASTFDVTMPAGTRIDLDVTLDRFSNDPSYDLPRSS